MVSKFAKIVVPAVVALFLGTACHAAGHDHGHGSEAPAAATLSLNQGKKWSTDENLRLGMERIRTAMEKAIPAIHSGKLSAAGFKGLAAKVNEQIAFMVQNCKLDQETDAMLHVVLADLMAGADVMAAKGDADIHHRGAVQVLQGLHNYGEYFDHPGWH